eukprot:3645236-Rhodomonas_salina.2
MPRRFRADNRPRNQAGSEVWFLVSAPRKRNGPELGLARSRGCLADTFSRYPPQVPGCRYLRGPTARHGQDLLTVFKRLKSTWYRVLYYFQGWYIYRYN